MLSCDVLVGATALQSARQRRGAGSFLTQAFVRRSTPTWRPAATCRPHSVTHTPLQLATRPLAPAALHRPRRSRGAVTALSAADLAGTCERVTSAFPAWVLVGCALGLSRPQLLSWFTQHTTPALALVMLTMGATLSRTDLDEVLSSRSSLGHLVAGVSLQYLIMPLTAFAITRLLPLSPAAAAGLVLVGCCPGGAASNIVCLVAGASVALSVVLTACSTFAAAFATPALTSLLAGRLVPVDASALAASTAAVVLLPLACGLALQATCPGQVRAMAPLCPPIAVVTVAMICGSVVANSSAAIASTGPVVLLAVVLLHMFGFAAGYACAAVLQFPERVRRTISIEVGMQNSALGCVLALAHFGPEAAVPCAISATVHSCVGSLLAGIWRRKDRIDSIARPADRL